MMHFKAVIERVMRVALGGHDWANQHAVIRRVCTCSKRSPSRELTGCNPVSLGIHLKAMIE